MERSYSEAIFRGNCTMRILLTERHTGKRTTFGDLSRCSCHFWARWQNSRNETVPSLSASILRKEGRKERKERRNKSISN